MKLGRLGSINLMTMVIPVGGAASAGLIIVAGGRWVGRLEQRLEAQEKVTAERGELMKGIDARLRKVAEDVAEIRGLLENRPPQRKRW